MLLHEPVQSAIWDALNHYDYTDATFLAERLYAEVKSDESQYLLATCYYRAGKPKQTYCLLQKRGLRSADCKFLFAKCCFDIKKYSEAELTLAGNIVSKQKTHEEIESEFGNLASHVFSLLGAIYMKTERLKKAVECYTNSLKLNPLLWSSFEQLCQLGEKVDPTTVFHAPSQTSTNVILQNTKQAHIAQNTPPIKITQVLRPVTEEQSPNPGIGSLLIPGQDPKLLTTPDPPSLETCQHTPENTHGNIHDQVMRSITQAPRTQRKIMKTPTVGGGVGTALFTKTLHLSPLTPSFGILPLETPSPDTTKASFVTPTVALQETNNESKAPRKPITRRANQTQTLMPKPPTFNQSGNTRDINSSINSQNNPQNVRRSSRLFGNSNSSSVKENNKQQSKSRLTSPKAVGRKSKTRLNKTKQDLNDINKGEIISDIKPIPNSEGQPQLQLAHMQQQSLAGILILLQAIGKAYQALSQYNCRKAIELYEELSPHQYNTGWVLCQVGRAYFELSNYHEAERVFAEVRQLEPYHVEGMEIYSTTLWHLQKEVELSALAQQLLDMNVKSPEAWCAVGNCFSVQKEHDNAIKFFERAVMLDLDFAYAYTLLGHEFVYTEELGKAFACFRNAIKVDSRHYNAWYGVGLIYHKQEKFSLAEVHFRKALSINPESSALLCHIGVVQHAQLKTASALATLNKAITLDPKNPLSKFHRASILFSIDKNTEALEDLEELKQLIPTESLVYFLIGKIHKKLGNTHIALMNFSWAMDLDPKGLNNQIKEAIDKRYVSEEDDSRNNESGLPDASVSRSESSLVDPDDMLQAVESDESL